MSFGPKAVQKNTKNVKKKNELSMHTGINIPSRIPKTILKIQKKNFKKTYELENKTENLKIDPRPSSLE